MQMSRFRQNFTIVDRSSALTTAFSGAVLVLLGLAILAAGLARAGEAATAAVVETTIFGVAATALGAVLFRFGFRAARRLGPVEQLASPGSKSDVDPE